MITDMEETIKDHESIIHELKENQIRLSMIIERHDKDLSDLKTRKTNIFDKVIIAILSSICIALISYLLSGGFKL